MKLTNLSEYEVDYFFYVDEFQLPLGKHIDVEFCKIGAIDLTTQHDQEYGSAECEQQSVSSLEQQKLTKVARWSNLIIFLSAILTVREICQFLIILQKSNQQCVHHKSLLEKNIMKIEKVIAKVFDEGEKLWSEEKLKRDAEKANHHLLYLQSLLAKC